MELWKEIEQAHQRIRKVILRTPIIYSDTLSQVLWPNSQASSLSITPTSFTSSMNEHPKRFPLDFQKSSWFWRPVVLSTSERSRGDCKGRRMSSRCRAEHGG